MVREYYFVVHFQTIKQNKIVPSQWIYEIDQHIEKFLNYGMNSSQRFRCYYTSNPSAFDKNGCPKVDWAPDFNLELVEDLDGDQLVNGCYVVKLLKCKGTYDKAVDYIIARRNIEPPVYNQNRLHELPIPEIPGAEPNGNETNSDADSLEDAHNSIERLLHIDEDVIGETSGADASNEVFRINSNENSMVHHHYKHGSPFVCLRRIAVNNGSDDTVTNNSHISEDCNNSESDTFSKTKENLAEKTNVDDGSNNGDLATDSEVNDALAASDENAIDGQTTDNEMNALCANFDENAIDPLLQPIKVNPESMHTVNTENIDQIINYIEEPEEVVVDDELTFYISSKGYAKPIATLMDGRCKREKFDKFSGMVKFFNTKKGRVYKIGISLMEIPFHLVDILIGWNTSPRNQEVALDKRFVNSLLMVLVPLKSLAEDTAPENVLMFIREMLSIRCTIQFIDEENVQNEEVLMQNLSSNDRLAVEERLNRIDGYKIECFEGARSMLKRPMSSTI